jgi:hypothetical protein
VTVSEEMIQLTRDIQWDLLMFLILSWAECPRVALDVMKEETLLGNHHRGEKQCDAGIGADPVR